MGRFSLTKFVPNAKISDIHGKAMRVRGRLIVPMYHPAAALHQPSLRPVVEADFAMLPSFIETADTAPEFEPETPEEKTDPTQLSMF